MPFLSLIIWKKPIHSITYQLCSTIAHRTLQFYGERFVAYVRIVKGCHAYSLMFTESIFVCWCTQCKSNKKYLQYRILSHLQNPN